MDIYTAINTRRTIRDFADKPIDTTIIEKIIGAGLKAPTNDHMRSWEFVIINDKNIRANLLQGVLETKLTTKSEVDNLLDYWKMTDSVQRDMYLDAIPKQYSMLYNAGCLILPFFHQDEDILKPKSIGSLNEFASIWCCIENMLLAATAEGIFGVTRIPVGNDQLYVKDVLQHPDNYVLPCFIGLGYPQEDCKSVTQSEINLKEKIHINKW